MKQMDEPRRLLRLYLKDHDGASAGGLGLLRRSTRSNEHTIFGPPLADLHSEIRSDQDALRQILRQLRIEPSAVKRTAAWCASAIGRVVPNGHLLTYSPLSRVLELEALSAAVTAKLCLWVALGDLAISDQHLDEQVLANLQRRARAQLDSLASLHRMAADLAFATPSESAAA